MKTPQYVEMGAIVLAGGQSRRMGRDKRLVEIGGRPLLNHVLTALAQADLPIVVVGSAGSTPPIQVRQSTGNIHFEWITDQKPDIGPIEGARAGLTHLAERGMTAGLLIGCDHPLFAPELASWLANRLDNYEAVCLRLDGRRHPLPGIYRTSLIPRIERQMANRAGSFQSLLDQIKCHEISDAAISDAELAEPAPPGKDNALGKYETEGGHVGPAASQRGLDNEQLGSRQLGRNQADVGAKTDRWMPTQKTLVDAVLNVNDPRELELIRRRLDPKTAYKP